MRAFELSISHFIILVVVIGLTNAHEGLTQEDILRIHQQLSQQDNDEDTVSAYQSSVIHGESVSNPDSVSSVSVEFHIKDPDTVIRTIGNQRSNDARNDHRRKVIRIKNPIKIADMHQQGQQSIDSDVGGSNQYAAVQYSLPPDDFLNQMRVENQVQQQNVAQYSTTQQPLYQYPPVSVGPSYETGQSELQYASSSVSPLQYGEQPDPQFQSYAGTAAPILQFASSGHTDNYQATPSPTVQFLSSPNPDNQYSMTHGAANYAGPVQNINSYPLSHMQYSSQFNEQSYPSTPIPEYGSRISSSSPMPQYDYNKNMQIDHSNYAVSGVRYPFNVQQLQNEVTTESPVSTTTITNKLEEAWRLTLNGKNGYDSVANLHGNSQSQLNDDVTDGRYGYNNLINQQSRNGYQSGKSHARGIDHETGQPAVYSHGDYGWKLSDKKSQNNYGVDSFGGGSSYYSIGTTLQRAESPQPSAFMNHMSTGQQINNIKSAQSLSYQPELNSPQDVNVGYSIGFGFNRNNNEISNSREHNLADIVTAMQGSQQSQTSKQAFNSMTIHESNQQPQTEPHHYAHYNRNGNGIRHTANTQSNTASQMNPSNGVHLQRHAGNSIGPGINGNSQNVVSTFYGNLYKHSGKPSKDPNLNYYGPNTELLSSSESKHQYEQSELSQLQPYVQPQTDLVTAFPYAYNMFRENGKVNQHFDHAKALKNIQPIDLTNVVPNTHEGTTNNKALPYYVNSPGYAQNLQNVPNDFATIYPAKDTSQHTNYHLKSDIDNNFRNYRDQNRPLTDAYYKDKNVGYGFNIKPKPDNFISPIEGINLRESFDFGLQKQTPYQAQKTYMQTDDSRQPQATNLHQTQAVFPFSYQNNLNRVPEQLKSLFQINNLNESPHSYSLGSINNLNSQVVRLNQDVSSHNLEASTNLLNKLNFSDNKENIGYSRPLDLNLQNQALTTVSGIKVANPYNIDLSLVSELLKGKPAVDETRMIPLRDHLSRMIPLKLDTSSFQQILSKSGNTNYQEQDLASTLQSKKDYTSYSKLGSLGPAQYRSAEETIETKPSGFDETQYGESAVTGLQNSYQSIFKHSRSQGDDGLPSPIIAEEASNIHPIGAVLEQPELNRQEELIAADGNEFTNEDFDEPKSLETNDLKKTKTYELRDPRISDTDNHPNSLARGRNNISLKQFNESEEPYPLLKPPRPPRNRPLGYKTNEKRPRFHRVASLKQNRLPNKTGYFPENPSANDYDVNMRVPLNLRPSTVLKRKTSTITTE